MAETESISIAAFRRACWALPYEPYFFRLSALNASDDRRTALLTVTPRLRRLLLNMFFEKFSVGIPGAMNP